LLARDLRQRPVGRESRARGRYPGLGEDRGRGELEVEAALARGLEECGRGVRARLQELDRALEQSAVHVVPDGGDVPGLLRSADVAGSADLEVLHADREARSELVHLLERLQTRPRFLAQRLPALDEEVAVRL